MFLSLIIPHYNLSRTLLERCIKSLVDQKVEAWAWEVIVIDDGSIAPPLWLREQEYPFPLRLLTISHKGLGGARNCGMEVAGGEYLLFVDADDYLTPCALPLLLPLLKRERPEILSFQYKVEPIGKKAAPPPLPRLKSSYTISGAAYMAQHNLPGMAVRYFFRRSLAYRHQIRFHENTLHEDEEFTTLLHYNAKSLICCNIPLYIYSLRENSITSSKDKAIREKRLSDLIEVLARLHAFRHNAEKQSNSLQRKGLNRKLAMLSVDLLLNYLYAHKSISQIEHCAIESLRAMGAYPLPPLTISWKYTLFRHLANHHIGLRLLTFLFSFRQLVKR